jgi:hypothetical protein
MFVMNPVSSIFLNVSVYREIKTTRAYMSRSSIVCAFRIIIRGIAETKNAQILIGKCDSVHLGNRGADGRIILKEFLEI